MTWQGKWCSVGFRKGARSRKLWNIVPESDCAFQHLKNSVSFQGLYFKWAKGDRDVCMWGSKNQISQRGCLYGATVLTSIRNKSKGLTAQAWFHRAFKHIVLFHNPLSSIYFSRGNYAKEVKACCREHLRSLILRPSWNADCIAFTQHELLLHLNQKETTTNVGSQVCTLCTHRAPCTICPNAAWSSHCWVLPWAARGKLCTQSVIGRRKTYKYQTLLQEKTLSLLWPLLEWKMQRFHFKKLTALRKDLMKHLPVSSW